MSYIQRKKRVRAKIFGTADIPRVSVFKSNKYVYAQVINDEKGITLTSARGDKNKAEKVGEELAKNAIAKKIKKIVFDRNGFSYHGRVKSLAEGARKGGLNF